MRKIVLFAAAVCSAALLADWVELPEAGSDPEPATAEYIITGNDLKIRQAIIDDNEYNQTKYNVVPKINYITIHNTAEPYTAMQERTRVNTRLSTVTSFQFCVDELEAVQILPDNTQGWHAGDGGKGTGNQESIGVEIARSMCFDDEDHLYRKSEANAVLLAAYLLKKYDLTVDDLRMHQHWSGKHCPHRILVANSWENFKDRVAQALATEGESRRETLTVPSTPAEDAGCINITTDRDSGKPRYVTQYSSEFSDAEALAGDLARLGIRRVIISSWVTGYDHEALITTLGDAGVKVIGFYVPVADAPDWLRENVAHDKDKEAR